MAASANPSGNQEGSQGTSSFNGVGGGAAGNPNGGKPVVNAAVNSGPALALKHNPGLATEWTLEEQSILEEGLSKYASESIIVRYAKIAMQLHDKTVRDVALRCRWMHKKESGKRRKDDLTRKSKDRREKAAEPSTKSSTHLASRPDAPPYSLSLLPTDNDDGISFKAIGGPTGQLLEQNAHALRQISSNLTALRIEENIKLFCQTRDNILTVMNDMKDMPGVVNQMPPLPVKLNEELANSVLPRTNLPMKS